MFATKTTPRKFFQTFEEIADFSATRPRVTELRKQMVNLKLDGFLVPRSDEYQGEYVADCEERLAYISGFTGSAGLAVILETKAAIFIDGRYILQIDQQVDTDIFTPVSSVDGIMREWLINTIPAHAKIGYDPRLHTNHDIERLNAVLTTFSAKLVPVEHNLVDSIWNDRPSPPAALISVHPENLSGETAPSKIERINHVLLIERIDALLVSDPHNIAWAFNIRGADVAHTPIALCYALIPANGTPTLFVDPGKISGFNRDYLISLAEIAPPSEMIIALRQAGRGGRKIRLDKVTAGSHLKSMVENGGGKADLGIDPITKMKAIKNNAEINGSRDAHKRDGAAMVNFLSWLDTEVPKNYLTEIDTVKALENFRYETQKLKDISFPTISGFGANGAIVHYRATETSNKKLEKGLFLIDSGAQYEDGTTDVTRTVSIGTPTVEMRKKFTRVLKGMIAISKIIFPKGTTGAQIDVLARQFLWAEGEDYDHGTGHGVGSYLSVHEGPQRISKTGTTILEPGMILSNEPGFYKPKSYGIRIENLILVEDRPFKKSSREFLGFETLTLVPIDKSLIMLSSLNKDEKNWLNAYHSRVLETLFPLVPDKSRSWLQLACAPV